MVGALNEIPVAPGGFVVPVFKDILVLWNSTLLIMEKVNCFLPMIIVGHCTGIQM